MFKQMPADQIPIGIPIGENERNGNAKEPVITVDALNQLIKENPNNMTQAIRSWMTNGRPK